REGAGAMPWERSGGSWLSRWRRTTREIVLRPGEVFARRQPGRAGAAFGYALVTAVLVGGAVAPLMSFVLLLTAGFLEAPEVFDPASGEVILGGPQYWAGVAVLSS